VHPVCLFLLKKKKISWCRVGRQSLYETWCVSSLLRSCLEHWIPGRCNKGEFDHKVRLLWHPPASYSGTIFSPRTRRSTDKFVYCCIFSVYEGFWGLWCFYFTEMFEPSGLFQNNPNGTRTAEKKTVALISTSRRTF
jgi:hypothetical protein